MGIQWKYKLESRTEILRSHFHVENTPHCVRSLQASPSPMDFALERLLSQPMLLGDMEMRKKKLLCIDSVIFVFGLVRLIEHRLKFDLIYIV